MSSPSHVMHATHHALMHTGPGKKIAGYAVAGTVSAAHVLGGAGCATLAAAAAPVVVPVAIAGGVAYLVSKLFSSH